MLHGLTNYTDISYFTWSGIGKQNNTVKCTAVNRGFSADPVFQGVAECCGVPGCCGVPECSGVLGCSGVPVFLVLVHATQDAISSLERGNKTQIKTPRN